MKTIKEDEIISNYCKKRDYILIHFEEMSDTELLNSLLELNDANIPSSPEIARVGLHKMRLYVTNISTELQLKSKKWLLDNGYDLEIY